MAGQGKVQRVIDSYGGVPCDWIRPDDCPIRPGEPCGEIHQTCRGHKRSTNPDRADTRGDPCGAHAMEGQTICRVHGGRTPNALAKAERTLEAEAAARAVSKRLGQRGAAPVTDPAHELARLAGEAIAWKDAALELVAELEQATDTTHNDVEDPNDDGDPLGLGSGIVVLGTSGLDVHPLVKLAERAQERGAKVLAEMVKLGFVERRVQIEEAQADALQQALASVLADHGIDAGLVLPDLAARLHALEATATEVA